MEQAPQRLSPGHLCLDQTQSLTEAARTAAVWEATLERLALDSSLEASIRYYDTLYHARLN